MIILLLALLGLVIGSFLNVIIDRLPQRKSIVNPPSRCDACGQKLRLLDLVPVFSYLLLRGKCRSCGTRIPIRSPLVEIFTALIFILTYLRFGFTPATPVCILYVCLLLALSVIDLEKGLLPNRLVYPGIVVAFLLSLVVNPGTLETLNWSSPLPVWEQLVGSLTSVVLGGILYFLFLLLPALIIKGGMGFGDVKLALLVGLMTGLPLVIVAFFIAALSGGLVGITLITLKVRGRKDSVPFGPFISAGAVVALFYGSFIWNWYIGLIH